VRPSAKRVIELSGSFNLRDLGELTGGSGRPLPRGPVYRSEYPGFVGALVLSVLGVSEGDVVEDYLLTEAGLAPILD